jgi:uncharacterized membrane protein
VTHAMEKIVQKEDDKTRSSQRFLLLFLVGFVIVFVGIIILMITALFYGDSAINFGGVIFIGPFPIVIGVGPDAILMVLFAIIFAVLSIIMFLILHKEIVKINA